MATWSELKNEIEQEYDLTEETFVNAAELLQYANSAIEDIEKEIHTLNDKYFHTETDIPLSVGVDEYDLPTDIYATKITGMYYDDGSDEYEVKELKNLRQISDVESEDYYRYRIINSSASGMKIKLYPPSRITGSNITLHYRRRINLLVDDNSVLDVPEAKEFVKQFVIDKCVNKERLTPDAPESAALGRKRKALLDSLAKMIDDDATNVDIDTTYYEEFL